MLFFCSYYKDADKLRQAVAKAGSGRIGNYDFVSFTSQGTGLFRPFEGANPEIGEVGKLVEVGVGRIKKGCEIETLSNSIRNN